MTDHDPTTGYDVPPAPPPVAPPPPPQAPALADPVGPAPTSPVVRATASRPGGSRLRWLVALVVTVLVAGAAGGATLLLTGSEGSSAVSAWAPSDTVSYAELRLDLSGRQQTELPRFMAAFPGFADQAAFGTKLGELADELVKAATNGKHDYLTEIQPWFDGQVALAMGPMPATSTSDATASHARGLLLTTVKDATAAKAWVESILTEAGGTTVTDETYAGTPVRVIAPAADTTMSARLAYGVVGDVLIAGDLASVQASIDTGGTKGLASAEAFKTAVGSLPGDRLALAFTDNTASLAAMSGSLGTLDTSGVFGAIWSVEQRLTPGWVAMGVRASGGNLVMDVASPHVTAFGDPANAPSDLAAVAPADTLLLATGRDLGSRLAVVRQVVADQPQLADALSRLDQALGVLGGFDAVTGWMGESGMAIARDGDTVDGGLLIAPTDPAAARRVLTSIESLATLGTGGQLQLTRESYDGTTITSLDLATVPGLSGGELSMLPGAHTLAWAATDQVVVLGMGTGFVKAVLDAPGNGSLADQARFSSGLGTVGSSSSGVLWVDVDGLRQLVEPLIPAADQARYTTDLKPYLEPLDSIVGATVAGKEVDRQTILLTVKH